MVGCVCVWYDVWCREITCACNWCSHTVSVKLWYQTKVVHLHFSQAVAMRNAARVGISIAFARKCDTPAAQNNSWANSKHIQLYWNIITSHIIPFIIHRLAALTLTSIIRHRNRCEEINDVDENEWASLETINRSPPLQLFTMGTFISVHVFSYCSHVCVCMYQLRGRCAACSSCYWLAFHYRVFQIRLHTFYAIPFRL